jgi:hypothetical protein
MHEGAMIRNRSEWTAQGNASSDIIELWELMNGGV